MLQTSNYQLQIPQASDSLKEALLVFISNSFLKIDQTMFDTRFIGEEFTSELKTKLMSLDLQQIASLASDVSAISNALSTAQTGITNNASAVSANQTSISDLNTDLSNLSQDIANIKLALDEDGDGSILDTIADIKTLINSEDQNLLDAINSKADQSFVNTMNNTLTALEQQVASMEQVVTDSVTGLTYTVGAENGVIKLIETTSTILHYAKENLVLANTVLSDDIALPNSIDGCMVSWSTSDANVITSIGTIARPAYGELMSSAVLTATISLDGKSVTKTFDILVEPVTAQEQVNAVATSLTIAGASTVTSSLSLPTLVDHATIAWVSDNTAYLANNGTLVNQPVIPEIDITLNLTATLSLENATQTKVFSITILAREKTDAEKLADYKTALSIANSSGLTEDVILPTIDGDINITWVSSKEEVITTSGVITRPAYGEVDGTANLTATITLNSETDTKVIPVVVLAITESEQITIDADTLTLGDISALTSDIILPDSIGGSTVSWASTDESIISASGVITRPVDMDTNVTLTATITLGASTETKEFIATVLMAV